MNTRISLLMVTFLTATIALGQSITLGVGSGSNGISTASFDQLQSNLGYKAANRNETTRVDGSPYIFEIWDQNATITTKSGKKLKFVDVNFDGRRNKIVARINKDSIYTFNSLGILEAEINGKTFKNIAEPNDGAFKVYEIIAEGPDFTILKDYVVDINEGSSNPMRGTIYARYITRDGYKILTDKKIEKFSLKKKKVLKLLTQKETQVKTFVEEKDLSFKNEEDVHEIVTFYTTL